MALERWTKVSCDVGCFIRPWQEGDDEDQEVEVYFTKTLAKKAAREHIGCEINNLKKMLKEVNGK